MLKKLFINNAIVAINVDGTEVHVNGKRKSLYLHKRTNMTNAKPFYYVRINNKSFLVHRLVAMAYVPNPHNYPFAIHLDTDTQNNYYKNLSWGYQYHIVQNMKVAQRGCCSENRGISKIKKEDISSIISRIKNGETLRSIAKDYNTSDMSIHRVKKRYCKTEK